MPDQPKKYEPHFPPREPTEITRAHAVFTERYRDLVTSKRGYFEGDVPFGDLCANYDAAKNSFDTWMDQIHRHRDAQDRAPFDCIDP